LSFPNLVGFSMGFDLIKNSIPENLYQKIYSFIHLSIHSFIHSLALQCTSTEGLQATCVAALELPKLNYIDSGMAICRCSLLAGEKE